SRCRSTVKRWYALRWGAQCTTRHSGRILAHRPWWSSDSTTGIARRPARSSSTNRSRAPAGHGPVRTGASARRSTDGPSAGEEQLDEPVACLRGPRLGQVGRVGESLERRAVERGSERGGHRGGAKREDRVAEVGVGTERDLSVALHEAAAELELPTGEAAERAPQARFDPAPGLVAVPGDGPSRRRHLPHQRVGVGLAEGG